MSLLTSSGIKNTLIDLVKHEVQSEGKSPSMVVLSNEFYSKLEYKHMSVIESLGLKIVNNKEYTGILY